jgi:hypothetical protein
VPLVLVCGAQRGASAARFAGAIAAALGDRNVPFSAVGVLPGAPGECRRVDDDGLPASSPLWSVVDAGARPVRWLRFGAGQPLAACAPLVEGLARPTLGIGTELAAVLRPWLSIAITEGTAPASWPRLLRRIRPRIDLELAHPRPRVAEGIARALASRL